SGCSSCCLLHSTRGDLEESMTGSAVFNRKHILQVVITAECHRQYLSPVSSICCPLKMQLFPGPD
uniref:Uncharacterized protein n=1 Tax=Aegilops tauschii subsp. strangulata TaxID=200361 RepID=A0A453Q0V4_AEGTS